MVNEIKSFVEELNKNTGKAMEIVTGTRGYYLVNERLKEVANNGGFYVLLDKAGGDSAASRFSRSYVANAGDIIVANQDQVYSGRRDCILSNVSAYPNVNLKGIPFIIKRVTFNAPKGQVTIEKKFWDLMQSKGGNFILLYVIDTPHFNYLIGTAVVPADKKAFEEKKNRVIINITLTKNHIRIINELGYKFDEKLGLVSDEEYKAVHEDPPDHETYKGGEDKAVFGKNVINATVNLVKAGKELESAFEEYLKCDVSEEDVIILMKDIVDAVIAKNPTLTKEELEVLNLLKELLSETTKKSEKDVDIAKIFEGLFKGLKKEQKSEQEPKNKYARYSKMTNNSKTPGISEEDLKAMMQKAANGDYDSLENIMADGQKVIKTAQESNEQKQAHKESPKNPNKEFEDFLKNIGASQQGCGCGQHSETEQSLDPSDLINMLKGMGLNLQTENGNDIDPAVIKHIMESMGIKIPQAAPKQETPKPKQEAPKSQQTPNKSFDDMMKGMGMGSGGAGSIDISQLQNMMKAMGMAMPQGAQGAESTPQIDPAVLQNLMKMISGMGQMGQGEVRRGEGEGMPHFDAAALQNLMKMFGASIPTPKATNEEKDDSIEIDLDDIQTSSGDKTDDEINELLAKLHAAVEKKKKGL